MICLIVDFDSLGITRRWITWIRPMCKIVPHVWHLFHFLNTFIFLDQQRIEQQIASRNLIYQEYSELKKRKEALLAEIEKLEGTLFKDDMRKRIQELYRENRKFAIDINCLANIYDLKTGSMSNQSNQHISSQHPQTRPTHLSPYPMQANIFYPSTSGYSNQHVHNVNDFYNSYKRQGSLNILEQVIPEQNQMWMQPVNVYNYNNVPPIPPRPSGNSQLPPARPSPPLPPRTNKFATLQRPRSSNEILDENDNIKWKCTRCTYDNDDSLMKCEMCGQNKLGNDDLPHFRSLHSLADTKSRHTSKKRNKRF